MGRPIMAFLSWPPSRLLAVCHNLWSIELWHDAVLGLSHPNYPMLNDIKLPLCYKSTAEHNSFVYCLSILCPFLAPSPPFSPQNVQKCISIKSSPWNFMQPTICILKLGFCPRWSGCDIPPKITKLLFAAREINLILVWQQIWRGYRLISK